MRSWRGTISTFSETLIRRMFADTSWENNSKRAIEKFIEKSVKGHGERTRTKIYVACRLHEFSVAYVQRRVSPLPFSNRSLLSLLRPSAPTSKSSKCTPVHVCVDILAAERRRVPLPLPISVPIPEKGVAASLYEGNWRLLRNILPSQSSPPTLAAGTIPSFLSLPLCRYSRGRAERVEEREDGQSLKPGNYI